MPAFALMSRLEQVQAEMAALRVEITEAKDKIRDAELAQDLDAQLRWWAILKDLSSQMTAYREGWLQLLKSPGGSGTFLSTPDPNKPPSLPVAKALLFLGRKLSTWAL